MLLQKQVKKLVRKPVLKGTKLDRVEFLTLSEAKMLDRQGFELVDVNGTYDDDYMSEYRAYEVYIPVYRWEWVEETR